MGRRAPNRKPPDPSTSVLENRPESLCFFTGPTPAISDLQVRVFPVRLPPFAEGQLAQGITACPSSPVANLSLKLWRLLKPSPQDQEIPSPMQASPPPQSAYVAGLKHNHDLDVKKRFLGLSNFQFDD